MGWDACATINGEYFGIGERLLPSDAHLRDIFKVANDKLTKIVGVGDDYLVSGELGGWRSKLVLERATQERCFDVNNKSGVIDWSAEMVKRLNTAADWSFPKHSASEDAYAPYHYDEHTFWCVKIFLDTCAANNLGIKFTW